MYCRKCGAQIPDESKFCRACGQPQAPLRKTPPEPGTVRVRPVTPPAPPEDGTVRVRPAQKPAQKPAPNPRPAGPGKKHRRRSGGIAAAIIACVVLIVAMLAALGIFVIYPLFSPSDADSPAPTAQILTQTPAPADNADPDDAADRADRESEDAADEETEETEETLSRPAAYAEAAQLLESGDYEAAIAAFEALGDYEDSPAQCQTARYAYAREKMDEKAYDIARDQFLLLGDYEDSAERAGRCSELLAILAETAPRIEPSSDDCGQFILAELSGSSATLTYYEKTPVGWEACYSFSGAAGKNGLSSSKSEGDNCTPAGEYDLLFCFGETTPETNLPFIQTNSNSVFVDDSSSPYYNTLQLQNSSSWSSSEALHSRYFQNGAFSTLIYIAYNGDGQTAGSATAGRGSMVTLCGKSGTLTATGGCIDISTANMTLLLSQLDGAKNPVIVITSAQ